MPINNQTELKHIGDNFSSEKKTIKVQEQPSLSDMQDEIPVPEEFFTNITEIIYTNGTKISGDLDSLKNIDNDNLILNPSISGSTCEYNITFEFGCDFLNFDIHAIDYYDLFLYLKFETNPLNSQPLSFKRLTTSIIDINKAVDSGYIWENIGESITYGNPINISRLFLERTFKFRLVEEWFGPSKTVSIDLFRLILTHKGTIPSKFVLDQVHDHERSDVYFWTSNGYLSFVSGGGNYAFVYRSNWWKTSNEFEIFAECEEDHGLQLDLYNTMFTDSPLSETGHISAISEIRDFYLVAHCSQEVGLWENRRFSIDILNNELGYENFYFAQGFNYASDSIDLITRKNLTSDNISTYLDRNLQFKYHLFTTTFCGTSSDAKTWIYSSYYILNLTAIAYGVKDYDYPSIKNITTTSTYPDGRIHPLQGFTIKSNITSEYQASTIEEEKTKFRIIGNQFDSTWSDLSFNSMSGLYESNPITGDYIPEGYYDLWINTTDSEGHSTLNVSSLRIYNAIPEAIFELPLSSEIPFNMQYENLTIEVNVSDEDNSESDYDGYVEFILIEKGYSNVTNWTELPYNSGTKRFEMNLTYDDLKNCYNGEYTILVRIEDFRGYHEYEREVELTGLRTRPATGPASDDDNEDDDSTQDTELNLILIISGILILSLVISIGRVYLVRKKSEKTTLIEHEGSSIQYASESKNEETTISSSQISKDITPTELDKASHKGINGDIISHKKMKETSAIMTPVVSLSEEEKKEVEKTESELQVEEQQINCIIHKGPIMGTNIYVCPKCKSFYCNKCATSLKEKGENCWVCDSEFSI